MKPVEASVQDILQYLVAGFNDRAKSGRFNVDQKRDQQQAT